MLTWLMSILPISCLVCKAENRMPCLIFSGNAEKELCIDLTSFNKITFRNSSMIITSTLEENKDSIELLYSRYNHLEIDDCTPTDTNVSINEISVDTYPKMYVDSRNKQLHFISSSNSTFSIEIFSISGHLLLTSKLNYVDAIPLQSLPSGVYIAIASDGKIKKNLKFILN